MFTKATIIFICLTLSLSLVAFGGDAKEALLDGMRKQLTNGPYRVKTTVNFDKGSTTQMDGEVVPPDQMHMQINSNGKTTEMICVGDKRWTKIGATWHASHAGAEMMSQVLPKIDEFASKMSNIQYAGEEGLGGKSAKVYTYHMDLGEAGGGVKSDAKVWLDSASGVPVKIESSGEAIGVKTRAVQTIEYDSTIKIEAPAK